MIDALQLCRNAVNELNCNSIVAILRKQNKRFDKALDIVERVFPTVENVLEQDVQTVGIRAATIFLLSLWSKLRNGVSISNLTKGDWENVLANVYEQAAAMDPKDYSLLVFDLYMKSIAYAIEPMRPNASPSVISRLEEIVSLMEGYAEDIESGVMPETKFIEENLWLSLEAVFLVMTDRMSYRLLPEERRELAEATSALVFQKIRYSLYDKELAVIDKCLEHQGKLDQKLTEQVNAYIDSLKNELDEFDALVEKAFNSTDFQIAFKGSADLAQLLGAEEILQTQQEIDDYFMS